MPIKAYGLEQPSMNLTPMIDVVFLLIIFFMVGTRFVDNEKKIQLKLPSVAKVESSAALSRKRVVHVMQDGKIQLDDSPITLDELTATLRETRERNPNVNVAVRGDADGAFQHVASVMAACRAAGVTNLAISVRVVR